MTEKCIARSKIKVQWNKSDVEWKDLRWFQISEDEKTKSLQKH
jgi:hypothetical protein